jgi:hypothetical protein
MEAAFLANAFARPDGKVMIVQREINKSTNAFRVAPTTVIMISKQHRAFAIVIGLAEIVHRQFVA